MEQKIIHIDLPFRSGINGKYKLLVKKVNPKYNAFEYELADAEGHGYSASSKFRYPENSILRCMVSFKVVSGRLVVSNASICKKQDLSTPIPEEEKVNPSEHVKPVVSKMHFIPTQHPFREGNPSELRQTGSYRLIVETRLRLHGDGNPMCHYILKDENLCRYHAISSSRYDAGDKLVCRVEVIKEPLGDVYFVAISDDASSKPVTELNGEIVYRHHYVTTSSSSPKRNQIVSSSKKGKKKPKITAYLSKRYEIGKRYVFEVTNETDGFGNQLVKDDSGRRHILTGTDSRYSAGDEIRCTVKSFGNRIVDNVTEQFVVLSSPRIVQPESVVVSFVNHLARWYSEVQDLGKHRCGKPFSCSCCGRDFPAFSGWRVELKEIYFCNACAKQIYDPKSRGNRHFYIPTPMGNKR